MGLLSRFKSLEGFSQRPLQEKNENRTSEGTQSTNDLQMISTNSSRNDPASSHRMKQIHQGRRASETSRVTSSSNIPKKTTRPSTALPISSTEPILHHHSRKRSITNPHTQINKIESGLPIPFERARNGKNSVELNMPEINSRQSSRSSLHTQNDQRKRSSGSIQSLNTTTSTPDVPSTTIEAEVVEKGSFPVQGSLITSSLRPKDFDSSRLFTTSWHSPHPSSSPRFGSSFSSADAMKYDDENEAEEIVDENAQSNDTIYAKMDRKVENRSLDSTPFYSAGIDTSSQSSFRRGSLSTSTLRKAGSRFMNGFKQSSKRPSTADASITSRQPNSLDASWRGDFHGGDSHATSMKEIHANSSFRLNVPRKSTDSFNSTISIGSKGTMTRSTTMVPSQAITREKNGSRSSSPVHEFVQDEKPRPTNFQPRSRTPSSASSHGLKAAIRANLSRPTSRSGPQVNHESQEVRSSPLLSPKSQDIDFIPYVAPSHSPAITTAPLPSIGSQQHKSNQSKQKLLPDQVSAFQNGQNRSMFRNAGLEKVSLSPAPRRRSKSRTSRSSSTEVEKLLEKAEPVPQIPSQYRDERRSSIAATSFHSTEDHTNLSTRSSEEFCDSIEQKSISDDLPGFRTSFSTATTTTSVRQHTPQSSISGSPSLTQVCSSDNKIGGGGEGRASENFSQRDRTEASLHLENNENRSTTDERSFHPLVSHQSRSTDEKIQLLTPESFSATSRSRMRNIQNLSSTAFEVE